MPHCVIECPASLEETVDFDVLIGAVHDAADSSGLFCVGDVKARLIAYEHDLVGGGRMPYAHVCIGLLSGRTEIEKKGLADAVVRSVCALLAHVEFISVDVRDFCRESYSNRSSQKMFPAAAANSTRGSEQ